MQQARPAAGKTDSQVRSAVKTGAKTSFFVKTDDPKAQTITNHVVLRKNWLAFPCDDRWNLTLITCHFDQSNNI
jgi:hypothetical protein